MASHVTLAIEHGIPHEGSSPMLITLSFLAGIIATVTAIRLYPILKNSQLAELVIIAVRNRQLSAPAQLFPLSAPKQTQAEKERAMAASPRTH